MHLSTRLYDILPQPSIIAILHISDVISCQKMNLSSTMQYLLQKDNNIHGCLETSSNWSCKSWLHFSKQTSNWNQAEVGQETKVHSLLSYEYNQEKTTTAAGIVLQRPLHTKCQPPDTEILCLISRVLILAQSWPTWIILCLLLQNLYGHIKLFPLLV